MLTPSHWPQIDIKTLDLLTAATDQVHRAAQYLSMAGKFFLPQQADDSHTNMGWNQQQRWFISHLLTDTGLALVLQPEGMKLLIVKHENIESEFSLIGQTQQEGVRWVRAQLIRRGLDAGAYKIDLHYEIPDHEIHHGAPFKALPVDAFKTFADVRTLGHQVMTAFAVQFEHASSVRTWPHHFDIGSYIPLVLDEQNQPTHSISIGLGIHDEYVDGHYFYVTHWSKEGGLSYEHLPELPAGSCWNRKDFTGAILKLSDLIKNSTKAQQIDQINAFMNAAIQASKQLLSLS